MINWDRKKILTLLSGTFLLTAFIFNFILKDYSAAKILYLFSILSGGYYVFLGAIRALISKRFLNIDFLVIIASIGAIYINQLAEAAAVVFFFSLAEAFEHYGIEKSRRALEELVKKTPKKALLKNGEEKPVEQVKVGEIIIIKPGDIIPLDGTIIKGFSSIDESAITGEPIPKDKQKGDKVFAGTINKQGYIEVKVTKLNKDSVFSKIVSLIKQAQRSRAPTQEFIDKFAKYYTPLIVTTAALITIIPPLVLNEPFPLYLYRALVLLVIACPCALVISTPVSIASALGGAYKRGILIKGGKHLESLANIKAIAFDKTKTLTLGEPYISDIITFNGYSEKEVLSDAAGLEKHSSHPLAKAIFEYAKKRGIIPHLMSQYENVAGKGGKAICTICNNIEHYIGNLKFIKENKIPFAEIVSKIKELEQQGKTIVLVSKKDKIMGAIALSDKIRPEAKKMISRLKKLRIEPIMLTGDNELAAKTIAEKVGIKKFFASLLPNDKVAKIRQLKKEFKKVAMVGDGINDAPSLAASDVGIAIGIGGSDVAIETADIALFNNSLNNIPFLIHLSKKTLRTIKLNITASLATKAIFLFLAIFGVAHLESAIAADSGIAILVVLNSLRLFNS